MIPGTALFIMNSVLLGAGLAMDAFSVSIANAIADPGMSNGRKRLIAGTFSFFQFLMPMAGWFGVRTAVNCISGLQRFIPWIAFVLLSYIGGHMLLEGIKERREDPGISPKKTLSPLRLLLQGTATSIDALSVGFTISGYDAGMAFAAALIIAIVTYAICRLGLRIGRKFGMMLAGRAVIAGGLILIGIGLEILLTNRI